MKDRSPTTRSTGSPTSSGVSSRMLVRSCTIDAVVALQRPGELSVADVDGDDLTGAGAQQHVGEAAGRGAGVEATLAGHAHAVPAEDGQRARELVTAARDVLLTVGVLAHHDRDVGGDAGGGLGRHRAGDLDPPVRDQLAGVLA